jgi:hypothetical protein
MKRVVLTVLLTAIAGPTGFAQPWATEMFQTTRHDFGTVARGVKTQFEFELKNLYLEDVHISGVRSSCGCTTPEIKVATLKTHEAGAIVARFNTHLFLGSKGATVTVTFDKPYPAEVQLHVSGYIRDDIAVTPGSVQFGSVSQGSAAERSVQVACRGRGDFQIIEVKSANPHISAKAVETNRGDGAVGYQLAVQLDSSSPAGDLDDHVLLVTNDERSPQIPVAVRGTVNAQVMVSPHELFLGSVQPGQKVTRQVAVKADRPFQIVSVRTEGKGFEFGTPAASDAKQLHLIPVTFVAGNQPGQVRGTIHIETDLGNPELSAFAVVAP